MEATVRRRHFEDHTREATTRRAEMRTPLRGGPPMELCHESKDTKHLHAHIPVLE